VGSRLGKVRHHDDCHFAGFYASEANAPSKEDAKAVLLRALELGINFYNTSNLYGPYVNEDLIGAPSVPSCSAADGCRPLTAVAWRYTSKLRSVRAFDSQPCETSAGWSSIDMALRMQVTSSHSQVSPMQGQARLRSAHSGVCLHAIVRLLADEHMRCDMSRGDDCGHVAEANHHDQVGPDPR